MNRWELTTGAIQGYGIDGQIAKYNFGSSLSDVILKATGNNVGWGLWTNGRLNDRVAKVFSSYIDVEVGNPTTAEELFSSSRSCYTVASAIWVAQSIAAGVRFDVKAGGYATHWNSTATPASNPESFELDSRLINLGNTGRSVGNTFFGLSQFPLPPSRSTGDHPRGGGAPRPSAPGGGARWKRWWTMNKVKLSVRKLGTSCFLLVALSGFQICSGASKCDLASLRQNQRYSRVLQRLAWYAEWKVGPFRESAEAVMLTGLNRSGHCTKELGECTVYEFEPGEFEIGRAQVSMEISNGEVRSIPLGIAGEFRQSDGQRQASHEMPIRDGNKVKVIQDPLAGKSIIEPNQAAIEGPESYIQCVLESETLEKEASKGGLLEDSSANDDWPSVKDLEEVVRGSNLLLRGGKVLISRYKRFDPAIFVVLIRPRERPTVFLLWKREFKGMNIIPLGSFDARLDKVQFGKLVSSRSIKTVIAR